MSDNARDAEKNMQDSLEDSLGSALDSSFHIPPPTPKAKADALPSAEPDSSAPSAPGVSPEELEAWKHRLDEYTSEWQVESQTAREKAEATRKRIEDEHAAQQKKLSDLTKADKVALKQKETEAKNAEKLRAELGAQAGSSSNKGRGAKSGRAEHDRVKEAWELVREEDGIDTNKAAVTDGRGVTAEDILAGQAIVSGQERTHVQQTAYNPLTSNEPLPPSMLPRPSPPTPDLPTESSIRSRQSATSEAWQEISRASSSPEGISPPISSEESINVVGQTLTNPVPRGITYSGSSGADSTSNQPQSGPTGDQNHPPAQPPSLTLSLFTMPSHRSLSRVLAVVGINLILPFFNGVMLGFGEIFAREVVRVGRLAWRGERTLFGGWGVASVGLGSSRGFP